MAFSTVLLLFAALAALAGLAFALSHRFRQTASRLDRLIGDTSAARGAAESLDRRFDELRRCVEQRVQGVETRLTEGQQNLTLHLGESGKLLKDVGEKMGQIFEASQKIEKLAGEVTRLEDLLKPPKLRGTLGETFLEQALRQVLPPGSWQMQHRFPDGETVDAVILLGDRYVPVDSKFPLENFRRARESEDDADRRRARTAFASDVRRHADTISRKYIRPASGTYDYAFMYIPAEAVYAEIVADEEDQALADYCVEQRVFPVSPRLLYAFLATVAMVLRGQELQRNAQEISERLSELARLWDRAEEPFAKLGVHLTNTQKQYEEASKALRRFVARLSGIAEGAEEKLGSESASPASLLPPA
ncbi:MAG: DNA recombination protein RmuC [Thermoanaerobaculia bacterium]